jgi:hypothetical protein
MAKPIVVVDRSEIRDGKLSEVENGFRQLASFVAAHESRILAYYVSFTEDRRMVTVLQIHPDSESMEFHMEVAGPLFAQFAEMLRMKSIDVYGAPSETLLAMLRQKSDMLGAGPPMVHGVEAGFALFDKPSQG